MVRRYKLYNNYLEYGGLEIIISYEKSNQFFFF